MSTYSWKQVRKLNWKLYQLFKTRPLAGTVLIKTTPPKGVEGEELWAEFNWEAVVKMGGLDIFPVSVPKKNFSIIFNDQDDRHQRDWVMDCGDWFEKVYNSIPKGAT